jgi:hypothetical protein
MGQKQQNTIFFGTFQGSAISIKHFSFVKRGQGYELNPCKWIILPRDLSDAAVMKLFPGKTLVNDSH